MEFYSLLDSYGYVVYENKKVLKKKVTRKIFFRVMKNFRTIFWGTQNLVRNFQIYSVSWEIPY